ncbi:hypothetical protein B0H14DRAFT_3514908 [Mycena olivaceomarginata]|nr:hypothetical protein B0H14DRAFT_3514908 [Mycena olivaceomarginata]
MYCSAASRCASSLWATPFVSVYEGGLLPTHNLARPAQPSFTSPVVLVVANRHPKPKETASIPALTSTSTADDRISSSPYAIQVYPVSAAPARPRPPPVHAAALAGFGAYVTIQSILSPVHRRALPGRTTVDPDALPDDAHGVRGGAPTPRCSSAVRAAFGSSRQHRAGGDRESSIREDQNAESGGAECRAVPCTGLDCPSLAGYCRRRRVLACVRARDVDASLLIARYPPSSISRSCCCSQRRAHYTASFTAVLSIGAAAGELSPPQVAAEKILAERSNRWPQVPKQLSLGLDYTNRPMSSLLDLCISSTPRRAPPTCIQSCLPDFSLPSHLIPPALPHLDYATMRFRGDAGSGSTPRGVLACPSRISTARRGVRGGAFALQLGDVHAAAQVFGTPQAVPSMRDLTI